LIPILWLGIYQKKFELEGFDVAVAADGEAGLAAAKAKTPAIILLDIIMPKMDGFTTLQALKEDASLKPIPVILLTNLGQNEDVAKGTKLGAVGYLIKAQLTPGEVVAKVREQLGKKA
jgi:two-component system phosphate regulon response regulator PhoB/two-component system alkaline phosphatase synthesis response regulator PhoP